MSCTNNNTLHLRIKAYFVAPLNEIRRFKLPLACTFDDFRAQVAKFYTEMKQVPDIQFQFIYLDDEKDWVRFNSDEEWQEAKCSGKNNVLRVKVCQAGKNCAESTINVCPKSACAKIENAAAATTTTPASVPYCQGCNHEITKGTRYKCSTCSHFNLCSCCYAKRAEIKNHDNSHAFAALCTQPQQQPQHHQHHSYHPYYHQSTSNNNNTSANNPCQWTNMFQQLASRWLPRCPTQSAPASNTSTPASTPPIVTDEDDDDDDSMMLDQELYKQASPSRCFKQELGTLETMGFVNSTLNESLLRQYDGNVQQVIEHLVKMYKK